MKKTFVYAAISAIALTACQNRLDPVSIPDKSPVEEPALIVFSATTEGAVSKTTLSENAGDYDVLWCNEDQITIVDGAATPNVGVYQTSSTTTHAEFSFINIGTAATEPVYKAYYPASIYNNGTPTLPDTQLYAADNISGSPMYAESSTSSLGFKNLCGIIRLNISTSLVGQKVRRITLSADQGISGAFSISSNAAVVSGTAGVELDCGSEGVAINSVAKPFLIAVPAGTYTNLSITVETTAGVSQSRKSKSGIEVLRSKITDITLPYNNLYVNLSSAATANCYLVPALGSYKFNATVKGNGGADLAGISKDTDAASIKSAGLLWASFSTATAPSAEEIIKDISYSDGYVYFSTAETFKAGNAVIAIYDNSDNILWSWHIWVYDYDESYLTGANSVKMMSRNLGSLNANSGNATSFGMYYQWGRKDPFVGPSSGTTFATVYGTAKSVEIGSVSLETAIQHPTNYYLQVSASSNWTTGDHWCSDTDKMSFWSESVKTIFDPCPPGWKVPSETEITGMGTASSFYTSSNGFPYSGYIGTNGTFYTAVNGTIWGTTVRDSINGFIQVLGPDYTKWGRSPDMGFNIRCVKE